MIYRPQFPYATPPGCRDVDFVYFFDGSNTPLLNQDISGLTIPYIPLVLDQDTPFFWRGWKVNANRFTNGGAPGNYQLPNFGVRWEDPYNNFLSDDYVPATMYGFPSNPWQVNNALLTGPPVPISEIYCPPGAVVTLYLKAGTLSPTSQFASVSLHGVKRYKECQ
jgi:hypothetical protein